MKTKQTGTKKESQEKFEKLIRDISEKHMGIELPDLDFVDALEDAKEKPTPFPYGGGKGLGEWVTSSNRNNPDFATS